MPKWHGRKIDQEPKVTMQRICAQCRNGEIYDEPATVLVSHPNPDHPNLRVREWVCDDHYTMLAKDYGRDLHQIREVE